MKKQRVGLAHEPVGNKADPLLRGRVEVFQGPRAWSEQGEWMRSVGSKFYRMRLHLESGSPKHPTARGICKAEVTNIHLSLRCGFSTAAA